MLFTKLDNATLNETTLLALQYYSVAAISDVEVCVVMNLLKAQRGQ